MAMRCMRDFGFRFGALALVRTKSDHFLKGESIFAALAGVLPLEALVIAEEVIVEPPAVHHDLSSFEIIDATEKPSSVGGWFRSHARRDCC